MKTVKISTAKPYEIIIGSSILGLIGPVSAEKNGKGKAVIVTDDIVNELYSSQVENSLEKAGFSVYKFVFSNGEHSKNIENYISLLHFLCDKHITRTDTVFALGGGVVGDMAGFTSATYLRGVKFVQIPTTLLAAVDSSVGGKTAVNFDNTKNLVGAFYQPDFVFCDYSVLDTLKEKNFSDGMAEIIKTGMILDGKLFEDLKRPVMPQIEKIISRCVEIKRDVVLEDEYDKAGRQLLNFGHTFGHAIEKCSNYSITHGHAVSVGMAMMTRAAVKKKICSEQVYFDLIDVLKNNNLPVFVDLSIDEVFDALLSDKKRSGEKITLVVPETCGKCVLKTVSLLEAKEFLELGFSEESV